MARWPEDWPLILAGVAKFYAGALATPVDAMSLAEVKFWWNAAAAFHEATRPEG